MKSLLSRIKKIMGSAKADAVLLMNSGGNKDSNFLYMTGFTSGEFENSILIVLNNRMILLEYPLEYEIAKAQRPKEMTVVLIKSRGQIESIFRRYLKGRTIGVNEGFLPYARYKRLKGLVKPKRMIDVSESFYKARSIKDAYEIDCIRKANSISKKSLKELQPKLREGMTEREAAGLLDYIMMKNGASGTAFESIVAFDSNSALPHHHPDNTKLKKNSIVLIDFGAKYNNYCADVTRTFMFMPDKKSQKYKKLMEMHRIVKDTQQKAFKRIREGAAGGEVSAAAGGYIDGAMNGRYKEYAFTKVHGLGHAIGIDVHDPGPGLYGKDKLKAGMVVSDEPGIYIMGFGGVRIEDDVVVTKNGAIMI